MLARNCQDMQNNVVTVSLKTSTKCSSREKENNAINRITDYKADLSFLVLFRSNFVGLKYAQNRDRNYTTSATHLLNMICLRG